MNKTNDFNLATRSTQQTKRARNNLSSRLIGAVLGIGIATGCHAQGDDYLNALDAELESTSSTGSGIATTPPTAAAPASEAAAPATPPPKPVAPAASTASNSDQQQFETVLQTRYIGTYSFYNKLSADQKADAYKTYAATGDMDGTRLLILKLFKSR